MCGPRTAPGGRWGVRGLEAGGARASGPGGGAEVPPGGTGGGAGQETLLPRPRAPDEDTGLGPGGESGSENMGKVQEPPSRLRKQHFSHLLLSLQPTPGQEVLSAGGKGPWGAVPQSRPRPGPRGRGDLSRGRGAAGTGELSPPYTEAGPPPWVLSHPPPALPAGREGRGLQLRGGPAQHPISVLPPPACSCEADRAQQGARVARRRLRTHASQ